MTPSTFISLASGRSMSATVTDDMVDVVACSSCAIPIISASHLSTLSCRPFCMYHCWTLAVYAARTDSPADVLSARIARLSCLSSAYWWYLTLWLAMTSATGLA